MTDNIDDEDYIVGLDIGTSKTVVVIGETLPDGVIRVLGTGVSPSKGANQGGIVDLDAVVRAIDNAIAEAESIANNLEISDLILGISGAHITGLNEMGQAVLESVVTKEDVEEAKHNASSIRLPNGLEMLHIVPQEFKVDHLPLTKSPIGLSGNRLTAYVHLIAAHQDWKRNLINAVESNQRLSVANIVFSGFASAYSVLTEEEKELGICLIDIGAGTMDVVVYVDGALRFSKSYPFGGNNVTDYLAQVFTTSRKEAETIKVNYGSAVSPPTMNADKKFSISGLAGGAPRIYTKAHVAEITALCYSDLFKLINEELLKLRQNLYHQGIKQELIAGFVLTGGGSQIEDIVKCAKNVFNAHVRVGNPLNIAGLTDYVNKPQYATVLGLLQYNFEHPAESKKTIINNPNVVGMFKGVKKRTRKAIRWIKSNF